MTNAAPQTCLVGWPKCGGGRWQCAACVRSNDLLSQVTPAVVELFCAMLEHVEELADNPYGNFVLQACVY